MNKYKLTFKLKQHTPIIHFQHDQHGATLRATELKPKLDRFLINKLGLTTGTGDNERPKPEYKNWFINQGKEHLALDYKVKINETIEKIEQINKIPNFFGNMGVYDDKEKKKFVYNNETIKIDLGVFNEKLKKAICSFFAIFLSRTNFGTRQNKGFGSFYLTENSDCYKSIEEVFKGIFYIEINNQKNDHIYSAINYYYSRLKSGINKNFDSSCNKEYKKSYLFKYFNNKTKKGWEKRWIKEKFFNLYNDDVGKFYIRLILGFSPSYKFKKTKEPCHKKNDNKINNNYQILDDYEIEVTHPTIDRYKSPITFKPIKLNKKTRIYLIIEENYIQNIVNNDPFVFYKKFIVKKMFIDNNNNIKTKQIIFPKISGSNLRKKDKILKDLNNQEQDTTLYNHINKINDDRKRKKLLKIYNNYIKKQSQRFETYLSECNINNNNKIYPPSEVISFTNDKLDLKDLISDYNQNELKNNFNYELNRKTFNATIK